MKRLLVPAAAAAILLAGCNDGPTRGNGAVATVAVAPDERTLAVGETLALQATIRDVRGGEPRSPDVAWASDAPAVATVDGSGVVTGVAPGTANVRATVEGKAGSVRVTVAAAPAACGAGGAVRSPAVGEAVVVGGIAASVLCLDGGAAGREYVAIPFHADGDRAPLPVQVATSGTVAVETASPPAAAAWGAEERLPDARWEAGFRRRSARDLSRWVGAARAVRAARERGDAGPRLALETRNARVGDELRINTSSSSCGDARTRTGRVAAVSQHAIVVADAANPPGLTDADYQQLGQVFDTVVWPVDVENFGTPGDLDENGRVVVFFTRAVNELTPQGSGGFVAGFFHARDLFPTRDRDGLGACAGSNYAEILYMLAADPAGAVNGNSFSRDFVLRTSPGTMAHELQHLINASRRLYEQDTEFWDEAVWLNEGLSHVAEELAFYRAAGVGPRQRLDGAALARPQVTPALQAYQSANLVRYARYLSDPEDESPIGEAEEDDDLATRGAAWAFLRYAADRKGGDEAALWRSLANGSSLGLENLQAALGADPLVWMRDWTGAVFADGVVGGVEARHTMPSWSFRAIFDPLPLWTYRLNAGGGTILSLAAGSGAFVRFGVPAQGTGSLRLSTTGGAPPRADLFLTVIRTK